MTAIYKTVGYDTLEEALAARAADTDTLASITISGATNVSVSGGNLTISQTVDIIGGVGAGLNGTLTVRAPGVEFSEITFAASTPGAVLVNVLANGVSITESDFSGGGNASRAFSVSGTNFTFTDNDVTGFINGSYVNPSVTGSIAGNRISDSGNGFVVDSTGVNVSNNSFVDIDRSNCPSSEHLARISASI